MAAAAYYNEIDPYAADWLRNLIAAGHIAPGDVDERSIEDVHPDDLRPYTQCHFFAGIGVWSYALRRAGWRDDRPVWTGSCPCQPFSAAGKGTAFDDERHLWPAWHWLIQECRPPVVFGEQVASKDAVPWLDLVQTDLEALGYDSGAVPFPSASIGAPHIRDRTYFVAHAAGQGFQGRQLGRQRLDAQQPAVERSGGAGRLADAKNKRQRRDDRLLGTPKSDGVPKVSGKGTWFTVSRSNGAVRGMADTLLQQRPDGQPGISHVDDQSGRDESAATLAGLRGDLRPGPVNGFWRAADWLLCRDGKWRPVEPGTFPLAHGAPARVGRLRAYGNAINAVQAQIFIEESMRCI
ncbi:DNA cytosine methyltransferase [Bordetella hinzii]|uniref:DNA cytosine methyltransferase n=1 Tax=Bordetella hinzii TaxID=103855 RepID=UPI00114F82F1|nr:DNA cytosine methyltransferase [Bordetella hinzii]QDJ35870.1 DNA cytosine methyltransferase [Bordetella hinzii]